MEDRKSRPNCVVVAVRGATDGLTRLALLAVTTQPPQPNRVAIEIPETEARRAGLTDLKSLLGDGRRMQLRCGRTIVVH